MKTGWPPGLLQDDCKALSKWFASRLGAREQVRRNIEMTEAMTPLSGGADDLPPLPAKRRRFFCTKCGSSECKPETAHERHPWCAKCDYLGFGEDCDYNDAETQAYARQAIESDRARRQGALTDEQIEAIFRETFKAWGHQGSQHLMKHFARAIIAALSLKGAKD